MGMREEVKNYLFFDFVETPTAKIGKAFGDSRVRERDRLLEEEVMIFNITEDRFSCTVVTDLFRCSGDLREKVGSWKTDKYFPKDTTFEFIPPKTSYEFVRSLQVSTATEFTLQDVYPRLRLTIPRRLRQDKSA